jgi:peptidase M1-like protein
MRRLGIFLMKALFISPLCLLGFHQFTKDASADNAPQNIASYKMEVKLKLDERSHPKDLEGREKLTWVNDSPDIINDLQFHLYLNAFKNEKSTFIKESGGQLRGDRMQAGEWGWIDVKEMKIVGGEDLTSKIEFIHPDDDNADDQTVIRVPLAKPINPGEKITLDIKFTAKLPRVFARTGYWGQFALVGQWFPKIGVWESVGERRRTVAGWNCHQFHAFSEFYADFGDYEVTITVPRAYKGKIGATGKLDSESENKDGTINYTFSQSNVHDFVWTVDPNYLVVTRQFNADQQVEEAEIKEWSRRLDLNEEQIKLKDVAVTLLIQPEHRSQIDRHFAAAFNAIKYFGLWYGKYPYATLTIVDPPYNADGASGMEYPTFITAGTSWWPGLDQNPEGVIVHEFGHQYWQGMVASNEFEESWLDEGFNTYSTARVLKKAYGPDLLPIRIAGIPLFYLPVEIPHPYEDRLLTLRGKFDDPILTPAWKFYDVTSYGLNSYPRTGLVMNTLEGYLGEQLMARVMREYHQKWRYRHPASQDFFDTVNAVTRQDLSWFFNQFVKGVATLDYEVAEVKSARSGTAEGIYDKDGQKSEVKADKRLENSGSYETEVAVRRIGEAYFPYELLLKFRDGNKIFAKPIALREGMIEYQFEDTRTGRKSNDSWVISDRWKKFKFTTPSELEFAQLDPEEKILLDSNLLNNNKTTSVSGIGAATRWSTGAMFWLQALLQLLSALG